MRVLRATRLLPPEFNFYHFIYRCEDCDGPELTHGTSPDCNNYVIAATELPLFLPLTMTETFHRAAYGLHSPVCSASSASCFTRWKNEGEGRVQDVCCRLI